MSLLNQSNTNKFKTVFSNIPIPSSRTDKVNIEVFNNYVKSVTLPDYSIEVSQSNFQGDVLKIPITRELEDLSPLTIDFHVDEDSENYITFFEWLRDMRCGNSYNGTTITSTNFNINKLQILLKDNQNRTTATVSFESLILINLSSLNLVFGSSEVATFSCTFQYRSWNMVRTDSTLNN